MALTCRNCSGTNIKTVEDRSKPVGYFNHKPIFRKKYICRACTHEWIEGEEQD